MVSLISSLLFDECILGDSCQRNDDRILFILLQGGNVSHLERSIGDSLPFGEHYLGLANVRWWKGERLGTWYPIGLG